MPAFKELAKKYRRTIDLAGEKVPVRGLTGDELVDLILEFPVFEGLLANGSTSGTSKAMIEQAPAGVAKFIAVGLSAPAAVPKPEDIAEIRALPLLAQLEMLTPIAELSLPKVISGPFVRAMSSGEEGESSGKAPDTQSPNSP